MESTIATGVIIEGRLRVGELRGDLFESLACTVGSLRKALYFLPRSCMDKLPVQVAVSGEKSG